jgi:hypothetical protein
MRLTLKLVPLLLLLRTSAFAQTPAASTPPAGATRTDDLLARILRTLEEQLGAKSDPAAVHWAYRCSDVGVFQSADGMAAELNAIGAQGWEYIGSFGAMVPGSMRVCFKRAGTFELSPTVGELGCSPACGNGQTCYKRVCIDACNPACGDDQYCANDHHCRTRTRPRK